MLLQNSHIREKLSPVTWGGQNSSKQQAISSYHTGTDKNDMSADSDYIMDIMRILTNYLKILSNKEVLLMRNFFILILIYFIMKELCLNGHADKRILQLVI
ncbi:MAG: hypothetical protein ACQEWF_10735 [Bacillota bacterium]